MRIPLYQVDAFADRVFGGNPAAVCPLDSWLPDATMQAIAAENNLSETAFFVPLEDENGGEDFGLRWFTPTVEIDLAGHPTLATAHVIFTALEPERDAVRFRTKIGDVLTVKRDGALLWMDFPARPPVPRADLGDVAGALGAHPSRCWRRATVSPSSRARPTCARSSPTWRASPHSIAWA